MLKNWHQYISLKVEWLANHLEVGVLGFLQLILLSFVPSNYENTIWHLIAMLARDFGYVTGFLMSSITLLAWLWKNVIRRIFKKNNENK